MALTPNFSVGQSILAPSILTLVDTSTGSDGTITERRAYFQTANGSYLVPSGTTTDYVVWPYADADISVDILNQDYSLSITVLWVNISGTTVVSKEAVYCFTLYSETFYYGLTQNQASSPNIVNDQTYYSNKMVLRCNIDEATQATLYASDIYSAQAALDRAAYMILNQNYFF